YPSGNLAVLVTLSCKREFVCLVLEDKANDAAIQAVFDSQGKGTCYYPNGVVWLNINIHGGMYLNENGKKVKHWWWNESASLSNSAPLKPIFLSLNNHTGVRILGQDRIFISFLAMGKQIKFNVGTKMQVQYNLYFHNKMKTSVTVISRLCLGHFAIEIKHSVYHNKKMNI
ncbi:ERIP6 protein, partial [Polypterus senegalus]|nr:ERIP6 protein [Polypterus senegalus]